MKKFAYSKWASEYEHEAENVKRIIIRKQNERQNANLWRSSELGGEIKFYHRIYRELLLSAKILRERGQRYEV